ncbi:MAG: NAD(P)-binding domain-containing protein, partial [Tetragenococcus koreensis]|nr:NAD(P)-binding domain-containing protein [Tetragenococcus koreensis]
MEKIVITPRGFTNYGSSQIQKLMELGFDVDCNTSGEQYSPEEFQKRVADAAAVIVGVDTIDKNVISKCPNLKVIVKFGVGVDNIDVDYANKLGIHVDKTIGTNTRSVAEHVIAMMFCHAKNLYHSIFEVKNYQWDKYTGNEIYQKTIGIIGFGTIGKQLSKYAKSLGMDVLAYDTLPIPTEDIEEYGIKVTDLDILLEQSDYISLHVPLNEMTKNLITSKELKKMKKNTCLLNTARGGIINEKDLEAALRNKEISAAYFDVFSQEPPEKND